MKRKRALHKAVFFKSIFLPVLLLCVTLAAPSGTGSANEFDPSSLNAYWGYCPTSIGNVDGKFRIDGYFYNHNLGHDIGGFVDAHMTLYDANNNIFIDFDVNPDGGADKLIIPASGAWVYSFAFTHAIDMADLTARFDLSSFRAGFECTYTYYECAGAGRCGICANWRNSSPSPTLAPDPYPYPYPDPDPYPDPYPSRQCVRCGGQGTYECSLCDGGILYYKKEYPIDIGGGSTPYEVPVYCKACVNGTVTCWECDGTGWR